MKNKLPKYDKYKPSGVEWLGEIPEHWEVLPVTKYATHIDYRGKTPEKVESGIFLITTKNIKDGKINYEISKEYVLEKHYSSIMSRGLPQYGDILFTMEAPLGMSALIDNTEVAIAQRIIKFRVNEIKLNPIFANYSIQSDYFQKYLQAEATGSTAQGIKASKLYKLKLITPPLTEQTRIAEFLDRKTAQIDQAIGIKEKQIALLKERRQIMIHRAVTRGISGLNWDSSDLGISGLASESNIPKSANQVNPDSDIYHRNQPKLKPSGVEWIGDIPEHWEVKRAKYLFDEINERSETGEEELLSVSHLTGVTPRSEKNVTMFQAEDYSGSKLCKAGDLVFNIMWAWMGALGVSDRTGIVSPSYAIYRQKDSNTFNTWYLEQLLTDNEYIAHYNRVSTGLHSSRLRFYSTMFFEMSIGFPPKEEQDEIVEYLKYSTVKIATAISLKEQEIAKLKEYKSVLINGAVTGKVKVV